MIKFNQTQCIIFELEALKGLGITLRRVNAKVTELSTAFDRHLAFVSLYTNKSDHLEQTPWS